MNVWGVSRSWAAADRCAAALPPGAKLGVWHGPVTTPRMPSSPRPALQAARRGLRPLTVVALHNAPGALPRRWTTRRPARALWPEPMGRLRAASVRDRLRCAWVSTAPKARVMAWLRWGVAHARNASCPASTPSVWCRNACRKRLDSA